MWYACENALCMQTALIKLLLEQNVHGAHKLKFLYAISRLSYVESKHLTLFKIRSEPTSVLSKQEFFINGGKKRPWSSLCYRCSCAVLDWDQSVNYFSLRLIRTVEYSKLTELKVQTLSELSVISKHFPILRSKNFLRWLFQGQIPYFGWRSPGELSTLAVIELWGGSCGELFQQWYSAPPAF